MIICLKCGKPPQTPVVYSFQEGKGCQCNVSFLFEISSDSVTK